MKEGLRVYIFADLSGLADAGNCSVIPWRGKRVAILIYGKLE